MKLILTTLLLLILGCSLTAQNLTSQLQQKKPEKKQLLDHPVTLRNAVRINTEAMEFAPVRYQNGLVFVTSRQKSGPRDQNTGETFFELYYSDLDSEEMPLNPEPFSIELNTPMHENSVTFNRRGDRIFFTRNNMKKGLTRADSKGKIRMKIYTAERGLFDWENVRELPFNDDEYSCMHPTLSPDEQRLFFSSDRPGGFGGYDIWFVQRLGEDWSAPINLGPGYNTTGNEVFPFMHDSGILFFSSDGYQGKGGLDLYMLDMSENIWGDVINLGEPFNSPADDLSLILMPDGRSGYFASNREGGFGKDDIFAFEAPRGISGIKARERRPTVLKVVDANNQRPLSGVEIRIFELSEDGYINNNDLYDVELEPSTPLQDSMVLRYVLKKEEALGTPKSLTNRLGEAHLEMHVKQPYLIVISKLGYETKQLNFTAEKEKKNELLEISLVPSQCITLRGLIYTDHYDQPVPNVSVRVINECTREASTVLSKINGEFEACLSSGCNFNIIAEKPGFQKTSTELTTVRIRGSRSLSVELMMPSLSPEALTEPIREGTVLILEDIFYDFNKSAIRTREARSLEGLAKLMKKYPSMEIELGAHTDSRGNDNYNLNLSLNRADSAKKFLVQNGIAAHRIKAFGYGETKPRNHCIDGVECSEEEYQYNRRTEVKITRMKETVNIDYRGKR
jgi:outer membrane protein OmpA-like peptidoglycan-associated protein